MNPIWLEQYGYVPEHGTYAEGTLYEQFRRSAYKNRYKFAVDYFGATIRYDKFLRRVDATANALYNLGIRAGDRVCICLPNMPDAAALFYAASRLGAVSVMVHPLSTAEDLARFLQQTEAKALFLMDVAYGKHEQMLQQSGLQTVVCCSMWEDAPAFKRPIIRRAVLKKAKLRRVPKVPARLSQLRRHTDYRCPNAPFTGEAHQDTAVIMFSGGSSAEPKGIRLSAHNFAALAGQVYCQIEGWPEEPKMMAILPFFHGFGLGVCMHAALIYGMTSIMVAQFNAKEFADILKKKKPNIITGVPTLYEALLREKKLEKTDLSFLKGVFVGGDACPLPLKERVDRFLKQHNAKVTLKEGYGLTETVTACVVTPPTQEKVGSIGVPLPDVYVKICGENSLRPLPAGQVGEIVISSPTLMLGYLEQEDTDKVIFTDETGRRWLRTGDLGKMDEAGYLFFAGRIKRIVKVSGFPVYPGQIEQIIEGFEGVARCCCISVPDDYKINVIKAIVQPTVMPENPKDFVADLLARCKDELNVYSRPRVVEILPELPVTKVGKVDWKVLQQREDNRRKSNN
ncbi:MAG: acyl--CoA ligase [Clostridia bacterium]|nr:acyl--CoA ligase [Clostridia bacterium]